MKSSGFLGSCLWGDLPLMPSLDFDCGEHAMGWYGGHISRFTIPWRDHAKVIRNAEHP